ncbi:MAG TPA: energy-coupling factor transporter transmembrane component T [Spirochaetia bacterium]|nr:energy-coupling factor transporter transmembrane component T [Spirochaetia bacterium]
MIAEFYVPGASFLHQWDARAKLLFLPLVLAAFFVPSTPLVLLLLTATIAAVIAIALGPSQLVPPLKTLWPVLVLITVLTPPFHPEGAALLRIGGVTLLTHGGLTTTLTLLARFLGITYGFFAVVRAMSLDDLVLGLRWFGLPYGACLVVTITLRTIPALALTWHAVRDAHRLRAGGSARGRPPIVKTYVPVLTSVMIEAVKGIPVLAMALESRGFGRRNPRTSFSGLKAGSRLFVDAMGLAAAAAALLWPLVVRW